MHNQILYSVLIPAYNAEAYLEECLDSVLAQTHHNLQVVVIDDGSTDRTAEILDRYTADDARVEVVHRENRGVATTRLELFSLARGKYINFVDADDTIEPEMAQVMIDLLEKTQADVAVCQMTSDMDRCFDYAKNKKIPFEQISGDQARKEFLEHNRLIGSLCSKVCRKDVCVDLYCPPEIRYGEDAVLSWEILRYVNALVFLDAKLYHYRMNDSSISHESIGESRLSGILAWNHICASVSEDAPELLRLSKAQQVNQGAALLRDIALRGCMKSGIRDLAKAEVRKNFVNLIRYCNSVTSKHQFLWTIIALVNFKLATFIARTFSHKVY